MTELIPCIDKQKRIKEYEKTHQLLYELMTCYLGEDIDTIERSIVNHVEYTLACTRFDFDDSKAYLATSHSVRDRLIERFNDTNVIINECNCKRVHYLSLEFLMGRSLQNSLINLGIEDKYKEALLDLGYVMESIYDEEKDAALGNGGLGRLAACFLDSLATLNIPATGYGIRYNYGIFQQEINKDGYQVEHPEYWLTFGSPWEIEREDVQYEIQFYGQIIEEKDVYGNNKKQWVNTTRVIALAYDSPINGFQTSTTINLRLWKALPFSKFNLSSFNEGDYISALNNRENAISISSILYPNDSTYNGKELRLKQQYFFVSATIQDVIASFKEHCYSWEQFPDYHTFQLNDTHPAVAIPELIRILVDEENVTFDDAIRITSLCMNYTNHTILPEALEMWDVELFGRLLPRHLDIIYALNDRLMKEVQQHFPNNPLMCRSISIFEESFPKRIRMANLCIAFSHRVNGVAELHTKILKSQVFPDFYQLFPDKFINITNGVTPRRWLVLCNPSLTSLLTKTIGSEFITQLSYLQTLRDFIDDEMFCYQWNESKKKNKQALAVFIKKQLNIDISVSAIFDVQIKRIHEYKRQLMNILYCIYKYHQLKQMSPAELAKQVEVVKIFAGKAAPAYAMAKAIIHLIVKVSEVINHDSSIQNKLKIVFVPNYNVSLAELIIPAADVSEHISTVGTEASGTSNMKFSLNGALLLCTMDGSSIEIANEIGEENVFSFGPSFDNQYKECKKNWIPKSIQTVFDILLKGTFISIEEVNFILNPLKNGDYFRVCADFDDYCRVQKEMEELWKNQIEWTRRSILTVAGMGKFSSDNSIANYCQYIWNVQPLQEKTTEMKRTRSFPHLNSIPKDLHTYH